MSEAWRGGRNPREDPEVVWRRVIRRRCEFATMVHGSWRYLTPYQLACVWPIRPEPEVYGPPTPTARAA